MGLPRRCKESLSVLGNSYCLPSEVAACICGGIGTALRVEAGSFSETSITLIIRMLTFGIGQLMLYREIMLNWRYI
jgi:hypothetical protein